VIGALSLVEVTGNHCAILPFSAVDLALLALVAMINRNRGVEHTLRALIGLLIVDVSQWLVGHTLTCVRGA
jgi:hypothetical protein